MTQLREEYLEGQRFKGLRVIQSTPPLSYSDRSQQKALADSIRESKVITAYCTAVENSYLENGYLRRPPGEKRDLSTHLEWTARVILGEPQVDIAIERQTAGLKGGATAISQAVNEILGIVNEPGLK